MQVSGRMQNFHPGAAFPSPALGEHLGFLLSRGSLAVLTVQDPRAGGLRVLPPALLMPLLAESELLQGEGTASPPLCCTEVHLRVLQQHDRGAGLSESHLEPQPPRACPSCLTKSP